MVMLQQLLHLVTIISCLFFVNFVLILWFSLVVVVKDEHEYSNQWLIFGFVDEIVVHVLLIGGIAYEVCNALGLLVNGLLAEFLKRISARLSPTPGSGVLC